MNETDIDSIIRGQSHRRRWLILAVLAAVVAAVAVVAYLLTRPGDTEVAFEPERAEAVTGRLSTEVELSGSAVAERSANLSFEVAGVVTSVPVAVGDEVRAGDALATLDGAEAQRRVETAGVQLRLAQLRLDNLLAEPDAAAIASAEQAIASANSQITGAEIDLERLTEPPDASELASAEQAVASALAQISGAEQALSELSEPPSASELASAEQSVATALGQISSTEQALAELSEPPSPGDVSSAEQAVANALAQLSGAEQTLAALAEEPSDAAVAESRAAITQAEVQLAAAERHDDAMQEALTEAHDAFCERYSGLIASDEVIRETCESALPLPDARIEDLKASFEDRSAAYETLGNSLIDANIAFVGSSADRDSAQSALAAAEERLADQTATVSEEDIFQAEKSVEAARASHAAAVARLDELRTAASAEDVYQAQQAVEAAKASHAAAVARLADLQVEATEDDVYQAEQNLEAARASHAAAVARREELTAEADEADITRAEASLETARAALASATAQYGDLMAGPSENAVEQQRQDLRLAELSLDEAREELANLTIYAPFDGVIEAANVQPGDRVTASSLAFTLSTSSRMLISLTVTEEELPQLEEGQTGVALFDAMEGVRFPVRVTSVGRVPTAEQGVVTYEVEALILTERDGEAETPQPPAAGQRPGVAFGAGGFAGAFPGFELPEGVTPDQVIEALSTGQPLPEGVELPAGLEERARAFLSGGGPGAARGGRPGAAPQPGSAETGILPAPGMSASVTILTEIREESVLLPVSTVRQLDGQWFVSVPAAATEEGTPGFERVFVGIGESDGENVEITGGLEAGAVVLIGADNAGVALAATLQQPTGIPGTGFGEFGPGGGGGGRR